MVGSGLLVNEIERMSQTGSSSQNSASSDSLSIRSKYDSVKFRWRE